MAGLSAGSARVAITPPVGTPLGGNARADNCATGVLQDLYVRALVVRSGDEAACVLSLDLLGLWEQHASALRRAVGAELGIPAERVTVACTHTHSGPDTVGTLNWSEEKLERDAALLDPWREALTLRAVEAARTAADRATPCAMRVRTASNRDIARNRRLRLCSGDTVMNWTLPQPGDVEAELGPVDPRVTAVTFEADGEWRGGLVHFACHPAILAGMNREISGDFCGLAMELLEGRRAPQGGAAFLFLNGAAGDVNHIDFRRPDRGRDAGEVRRCGESLARSVEEALAAAGADAEKEEIRGAFRELLMPIREIGEEEVDAARRILAAWDGRDLSLADGVPPELNARKLLALDEARRTGRYPGPFTALREGRMVMPLQTLRIGGVVLGTAPGEIFARYGLRFRESLGGRTALLIGTANGYGGYLPTPEAFAEGGYEPTTGAGYLRPEAAEQVLTELVRMAEETL